jgi:pimeloyl-ACP methyl ester carboxylesterase/DNA-binding CsgD family transcriptional regulator
MTDILAIPKRPLASVPNAWPILRGGQAFGLDPDHLPDRMHNNARVPFVRSDGHECGRGRIRQITGNIEVAMSAFKQDIRFAHSADGTRLAYASFGEGYPVVRAAHWFTNIEYDWQMPIFHVRFDAFASRYRYYRYDGRGTGLSEHGEVEISLDRLVEDLEAVVDAAGLEKFALWGTSQGGAVSIAYAAKHPERVTHLVLLGAYARGGMRRNPTPQQIAAMQAQVKLIEVGWGQDHEAFLQLFTSQIFPNATAEQQHSFNEMQRRCCSPEHAARLVDAYYHIDASAYLSKIQCPTLVLHCRGDVRVPFEAEGLFVASSIPNARMVPLESVAHVPTPGEPAYTRLYEETDAFLPRRAAIGTETAFPRLTPREQGILDLIARGLDNLQIAAHLSISEKTVRNNITSIFDKLAVENRGQAIVKAREAGMGRV